MSRQKTARAAFLAIALLESVAVGAPAADKRTAPTPVLPVGLRPWATKAQEHIRSLLSDAELQQLRLDRVIPQAEGALVRWVQAAGPYPIRGGGVTLRIGARGQLSRAAIALLPPEELRALAAAPQRTPEQARAALPDRLRTAAELQRLEIDGVSHRLVYTFLAAELRALKETLFLVDAHSGQLVRQVERVRQSEPAGRATMPVYLSNPVTWAHPPKSMARPGDAQLALSDSQSLVSKLLDVQTCIDNFTTHTRYGTALHGCELQHGAKADAAGNFDHLQPLVDMDDGRCPTTSDMNKNNFAETHAYWHAARMYDRFRNLYALAGEADFRVDVDGMRSDKPLPILVNVCIPDLNDLRGASDPKVPLQNLSNAFFAPPGRLGTGMFGIDSAVIVLGMGKSTNLAMDGEVVAHEVTHSVLSTRGVLDDGEFEDTQGLNDDSDAMNEGVADYFAATLSAEGKMGEYAERNYPAAHARNLDNNQLCGPDRVGDAHTDSQAFSGALWEARKSLKASPGVTEELRREAFDRAVLAALDGLPAASSMAQAATEILREMEHYPGKLERDDIAAAKVAFERHGMLPGCPRVLDGFRSKPLLYLPGRGRLTSGYVQWRLDVPAGHNTVQISMTVDETPGAVEAPALRALIRKGRSITWAAGSGTFDRQAPFTKRGARWETTLSAEPGVHYVMLANAGQTEVARDIRLSSAFEAVRPDMGSAPDAGDPDGRAGGGCQACSTSSRSARPVPFPSAASPLLLGILLLGASRLRRRAR